MATAAEWLAGARPRTLPAAVAPVLAGTASALGVVDDFGGRSLLLVALCAVVALALQIAVNYANDYSDGIRGTDADRVGPMRLVGSGAASPGAVKTAAFVGFAVAAVTGLVVVLLTQYWWLLAVGVASIAAAWFYTGGSKPYGYLGLGEVFVFIFFGLVAVLGTHAVLVGSLNLTAILFSVAIGLIACLILVANNLRDLTGDQEAGKRTLATRLGDRNTRVLFIVLWRVAMLALVVAAAASNPWLLIGLIGAPLLWKANLSIARGAEGKDLIGVLKLTGMAELLVGIGLLIGAIIGHL